MGLLGVCEGGGGAIYGSFWGPAPPGMRRNQALQCVEGMSWPFSQERVWSVHKIKSHTLPWPSFAQRHRYDSILEETEEDVLRFVIHLWGVFGTGQLVFKWTLIICKW